MTINLEETCQLINLFIFLQDLNIFKMETSKSNINVNSKSVLGNEFLYSDNKKCYMIPLLCQIVNKLNNLMTSTCLITEKITCITLSQRSKEINKEGI